MKKIKILYIIFLSFLTIGTTFNKPAEAFLPTFDASNLIQNVEQYLKITEQVENATKYYSEVKTTLSNTLQTAKDTLSSIRGAGQALKDMYKNIKNFPQELTNRLNSFYDDIKNEGKDFLNNLTTGWDKTDTNGGLNLINQAYDQIVDKVQTNFDKSEDQLSKITGNENDSGFKTELAKKKSEAKEKLNLCGKQNTYYEQEQCKVTVVTGMNQYAQTLKLASRLKAELKKMNDLQNSAKSSENIKDSQDIMNQILIEQAKYDALIKEIDAFKYQTTMVNQQLKNMARKNAILKEKEYYSQRAILK